MSRPNIMTATPTPDEGTPSTSTPGETSGKYQACVVFQKDAVRVVVSQPAEVSSEEREAYNSAHRQCLLHFVSRPAKQFKFVMSGDTSAPVVEVVVQRGLLEKLPLLHDIADSTDADCIETESDTQAWETAGKACIMLPCSVWGLVSLLLVAEGAVSVQQWFGSGSADCDPSLPAQTFEARLLYTAYLFICIYQLGCGCIELLTHP